MTRAFVTCLYRKATVTTLSGTFTLHQYPTLMLGAYGSACFEAQFILFRAVRPITHVDSFQFRTILYCLIVSHTHGAALLNNVRSAAGSFDNYFESVVYAMHSVVFQAFFDVFLPSRPLHSHYRYSAPNSSSPSRLGTCWNNETQHCDLVLAYVNAESFNDGAIESTERCADQWCLICI